MDNSEVWPEPREMNNRQLASMLDPSTGRDYCWFPKGAEWDVPDVDLLVCRPFADDSIGFTTSEDIRAVWCDIDSPTKRQNGEWLRYWRNIEDLDDQMFLSIAVYKDGQRISDELCPIDELEDAKRHAVWRDGGEAIVEQPYDALAYRKDN